MSALLNSPLIAPSGILTAVKLYRTGGTRGDGFGAVHQKSQRVIAFERVVMS
jgi:hypothetical protein